MLTNYKYAFSIITKQETFDINDHLVPNGILKFYACI